GRVLTISSSPSESPAPTTESEPEPGPVPSLLFETGRLVMTRAVSDLVERGVLDPSLYLRRHIAGDWGELCDEDRQTNQQALRHGDRLLSSYDLNSDEEPRLWIITEADRSVTTLPLPSDY